MLTYNQYYDTYHCIFRMLSVLALLTEKQIEFPRLRILDFYFSFPRLVADIQFPRVKGISEIKKNAKSFPVPYEIMPDQRRLFSEVGDFQIQAVHILKAKRIIKENESGIIELDEQFFNDKIADLMDSSRFLENEFFEHLVKMIEAIPLLGEKGLKRRTGLMEHRYDAI